MNSVCPQLYCKVEVATIILERTRKAKFIFIVICNLYSAMRVVGFYLLFSVTAQSKLTYVGANVTSYNPCSFIAKNSSINWRLLTRPVVASHGEKNALLDSLSGSVYRHTFVGFTNH